MMIVLKSYYFCLDLFINLSSVFPEKVFMSKEIRIVSHLKSLKEIYFLNLSVLMKDKW